MTDQITKTLSGLLVDDLTAIRNSARSSVSSLKNARDRLEAEANRAQIALDRLAGAVVVPDVVEPPPPPPPPDPPPPDPPPPTGFAVPFVASSSWNTPIPSAATYSRVAWPAASGGNYWVNWDNYSPAIIKAASTDPVVAVSMPANWGWPAGTVSLRIPKGVSGASGTDGELLVVDGTKVHNFWKFVRTSDTAATCQAYGLADTQTGTGWGSKSPFRSAGITAAGSSMLAGLLMQEETDAGEIHHAVAVAAASSLIRSGAVGEAIASDGGSSTGIVQEAEHLAIPRSQAMPSGLSPLGQKVFRAFQTYGAFIIDKAGVTIIRAQQNAYTSTQISALKADVGKIIPLLQRVS